MAIGQLVVKIIGDSTQLTKDLVDAGQKTESFSKRGRDSVNQFGKVAVAAFAAAAAGAAALVIQTGRQIAELESLASVSNTSVSELQRMAYASKTVGIEQDKLADILKDVNDRVGDFNATGGGPMADFFEKIGPKVGVTAEHFKNLSGPQALQLYVDSLQKANLSQADMTFYMEAMASDSTKLIPLLKDGGAAMAELAGEAEALGLGLSEVDVAMVQAANNELAKIGAITDSASQALTVELMPIFGAIAEEIVDMVAEFGGFGPVIEKAIGYAVKVIGVFSNAIRGVQLIVKGLEAGFQGFAIAVNKIFAIVSSGVDKVVNTSIAGINQLIYATNLFTGAAIGFVGDFVNPATEMFESGANAWSAALAGTLQEMHELAMRPLPSEGIEAWVDEVKAKSKEAAEAVAAATYGQVNIQSGDSGAVGLTDEENAALEKRLETIRMALMSEQELMADKYMLDQEALLLALENKKLTQEEYDIQALGTALFYQDELTRIEKEASDKRIEVAEMERRAKIDVVQGMFSNLSSLMNTGSKRLFEIGKAASVANALVSGYEAVVSSYAAGAKIGGPIVGAAYAATAAAATFAQIQQIKKASFGQTTAPVTFDGGIPQGGSGGQGQQGGQGSGGGAGRNISISLVGESFSRDQVRSLIDSFQTELDDGYKLTVSGG